MEELIKLIIVFVLLLTIYLKIDTKKSDLIYVKSRIDGNNYLVRNVEDKEECADLISRIRQKLEKITIYLNQKYPEQPRVQRLQKNFRPNNIVESEQSSKHTSYSINKGEKVVLCVRSKSSGYKLENENMLMFVALHELSHIMTKSIGHTKEFWDNFKFVLKESVKIGIYEKINFKKKPMKYCGTTITDSPI